MSCDDVDVSQRILPYVDAPVDLLNSLLAMGFEARFNRSNGFVDIDGAGRFRPSFYVNARNEEEEQFYEANRDDFGLAYQPVDINDDGRMDYKVITSYGVQVLYGAP